MPEASERLSLLEQQVQRAIELIGSLRADNARLVRERDAQIERVEALTKEVAALRAREAALSRLEGDHRRLLDERQELLGQVEGMLKELARIEGG